MARPSPKPPTPRSRASSRRTKRSKIRCRSASAMPGPSSRTRTTAQPPSSPTDAQTADEAKRRALSTRLETIRSRYTSGTQTHGREVTSKRGRGPSPGASTTAATTSTRSTGPDEGGSVPSSDLASSSSPETSFSIRSFSASTSAATWPQSAVRGWWRATSRSVRMLAIGERSSCEASETKRLSRSAAAWIRSSMELRVRASLPTSSSASGSATRYSRLTPATSATSRRIISIGRSARPTTNQEMTPTITSRIGAPSKSSRWR